MEPHRIDVPERFGLQGAYVLIRPHQSWAALNRTQAAGLVVRAPSPGETAQLTADVLAVGLATLETAVLSWHGILDMEGRPIPASHAGYMHDDLDPDVGDWLVEEITAFYAAQRRPADAAGGPRRAARARVDGVESPKHH